MSTFCHERQRRVLAHPAVLAALAVLTLNDFVLRRTWPSWFTGKLGDFAWLFAAPLVVAVLFAMLSDALHWGWERRWPAALGRWKDLWTEQGRRYAGRGAGRAHLIPWHVSGLAGFVLIGGIFALAKTIPAYNALVNATAGALFGFPVAWRRDPTDVVALLALLPAWQIWTTGRVWLTHRPLLSRRPPGRPGANRALPRPAAARHLAWLVVPVSMLLTMADSPQPRGDPGVYCLGEQNGALIARTGTSDYLSRDGGLSWELAPTPTPEPTWTPEPATPDGAGPDSATPGSVRLPRPVAGKTGLAAPLRSSTPTAGRADVTTASISLADPGATQTLTVTPGTSQELTETVPLTPTLDAAAAAQATLDASPMFIPRCAPRNPIADPNRPQVMYGYRQEDLIERSEDGGQTWVAEFRLEPLSEAERQTYAEGHNPSSYTGDNTKSVFAPRPLDAVFEPGSGNALFAMGHQGVLVRSAGGQWWWATLGRYRHLEK